MMTKKSKYGIKALIYLGKKYGDQPVQIMRIATEEQIPKKILDQILLELGNADLLYSIKGARRGYCPNKEPKSTSITLGIRLLDGPIALLQCVSLNFYEKCDECKSYEV